MRGIDQGIENRAVHTLMVIRCWHTQLFFISLIQLCFLLLKDDIGEGSPELDPLHQHDERNDVEYIIRDLEVNLDLESLCCISVMGRIRFLNLHLDDQQSEAYYEYIMLFLNEAYLKGQWWDIY